jgi:hypothetical protein
MQNAGAELPGGAGDTGNFAQIGKFTKKISENLLKFLVLTK